MRSIRFAVVIGVLIFSALLSTSAFAGDVFTSSSGLTHTAPNRLEHKSKAGDPHDPSTGDPKTSSDPSKNAQPSGDLPHTGLDLLPETLIGLALLGTGVALRARRA